MKIPLYSSPSLPQISGWSCLDVETAAAANIFSAAYACPVWMYSHWKETTSVMWNIFLLLDWPQNKLVGDGKWHKVRYSPVHNFKVRRPFFGRLDYFAWQAEEGRCFVKRPLALPAVQFNLTCTVIPGRTDWIGVVNWLSFLPLCFEVHAAVPCVLLGKAGVVHGQTQCWTRNSSVAESLVRHHPV